MSNKEHNHWWESISNASAIGASIIPLKIKSLNEVTILIFIFLLISYFAAKKIENCKFPFQRIVLIWSIFSACFIGIMAPILIVLKSGINTNAGIHLLVGCCFAVIAGVIFIFTKLYEKNT